MEKFIKEIQKIFPYNNDTCVELILALTFSDSVPKSSIVFLTESDQFKRNYSNTHRALRDYYCKKDAKKEDGIDLRRRERREIIKYLISLHTKDRKINLYGLDTTNHYRLYASKGVDMANTDRFLTRAFRS